MSDRARPLPFPFHRAMVVFATTAVVLAWLVPAQAEAITNAPATTNFVWAVQLSFSSDGVSCSGSMLTRHWIVTAGHCLAGRSVNTDQVRVRYTALTGVVQTIYGFDRASFYDHPDFAGPGSGDRGDDLGLVRLYGDGATRDLRAKIYAGPLVEDPDRWHGADQLFFVGGYGRGTAPGGGIDCPGPGSGGTKRIGKLRLTGDTDDNGVLGWGNPIAVEGRRLENNVCKGDSGAPWAFTGSASAEMLMFGVHSGNGADASASDSDDEWAALLPPRMQWVIDTAEAKGLPIVCPHYDDLPIRYRQCRPNHATHPGNPGPDSVAPADPAVNAG